jgi:phenylacetate-coenzyme A ligase PaaK-like adenylate-forming protein
MAAVKPVAKRDLRRGFPKALVPRSRDLKRALEDGTIEIIATSGTTEDRLQVIWDQPWWDLQERAAMRLNSRVAEAMANGYREAVLTTPVCGGATCHVGNNTMEERTLDGILFLNQVADPTHWSGAELTRMLDEWGQFAPIGVEADPAYLAALSRHAVAASRSPLAAKFVTLTYELATRAHRRQIAEGVKAEVYDLYGATETGVLFMGCTHGRLHLNAAHVHVDLQPAGERLARVIVTTLGRAWMPLLRYDTNDLVRTTDGSPCGCGRAGLSIERIEGRANDAVDVGGRLVTSAMIDDVVDRPGLTAWQLQLSPSGAELLFLGEDDAGNAAATKAGELLDRPVRARATPIAPEGSGKYRLVKSVEW